MIRETRSEDYGRVGAAKIGEGISRRANHKGHVVNLNSEDRIDLGGVTVMAWPGGGAKELQFGQHMMRTQLSMRAVHRDKGTIKKQGSLKGGLVNPKEGMSR